MAQLTINNVNLPTSNDTLPFTVIGSSQTYSLVYLPNGELAVFERGVHIQSTIDVKTIIEIFCGLTGLPKTIPVSATPVEDVIV